MAVSNTLTLEGRQLARKVLFFQTLFACLLTLLYGLILGINSGVSAALGGLTSLIPSFIFARFAFKYAGASQNRLVVRSFSKGSKLKFLVTVVLFSLAFQWSEIQFLSLITAYLLTTVAQWPIIGYLHRVTDSQ